MTRGSWARRVAAGPGLRGGDRGGDRGQATVELALVLPFVALLLLALIQVGLVVRARIMVTHAAREGARVAAVGGSDSEVRRAVGVAADLAVHRLDVTVGRNGGNAVVRVRYRDPTDVPIVGELVDEATLDAVAHMRIETPP